MASLDELKTLLETISSRVDTMIASGSSRIYAGQIDVPGGLSNISETLGIFQAGEFRAGNGDPGSGFTGMRMAYPSMDYQGQAWHLVGVNADGLQFGVNAIDGKLYAGGGSVILSSTGASIWDGSTEVSRLGDLNENWGYTSETQGLALGEYAANKANLVWDPTNGLRIRNYTTDVLKFDNAGGAYISGTLTIGTAGKIEQGSYDGSNHFTGLRMYNSSGIGMISGYNDNVAQWYANTDGKLYAGGGKVSIDATGINFTSDSGAYLVYSGVGSIYAQHYSGPMPSHQHLMVLSVSKVTSGGDSSIRLYTITDPTNNSFIDLDADYINFGASSILTSNTTVIANLNASLLEGHAASYFTASGAEIPKSLLTEQGSIIYASGVATPAELLHGAAGDVLQSGGNAANPSWLTPGWILKSLLTEQGDIIYASAANTPAALPHGTAGYVLISGGHGANPSWAATSLADGAVTLVKMADLGASTYGYVIGRRMTPAGVPEALAITPTGGITANASAGALNISISDGGVTLAKMADLAANTMICRPYSGVGVPFALTVNEQGIVGRVTGGVLKSLTVTETKTIIGDVTIAVPGLCPTAPNDTAKFLRGDATWATLPVAAGAIPLQPASDIVLNDTGGDFDWRLETDTNATFWNIDAGTSVMSIGVAPAALDANLNGMLQVTAPATTHVASFHSVSAGYGVYVTNSVAEGTASGGLVAVQAGITPSAADKRVGAFTFRGITTGTTSAQCASITAHSAAAWGSGDAGAYVRVNVSPVGSTTAAEVLRFTATTLTMADAKDIAVGTTTGSKIGTATSQKIGFWNATPVVQQAHIADPTGGAVIDTQCRAQLALVLAWMATTGMTAAA